MKNSHVVFLLIVLGTAITVWGTIANLLAVVGAHYVDTTVPYGSQESFIIHLGAGIAYYGWVITLAIIFIVLFSLIIIEMYNWGVRIHIYKKQPDVQSEVEK